MKSKIPLIVSAGLLALFTGCDAAKKFMDPTGTSYKSTDTAQTTASTPASAAPPATYSETSDKPGRILEAPQVRAQLQDLFVNAGGMQIQLAQGQAKAGKTTVSVQDNAGNPWAIAITDLNKDGADDALAIVKIESGSGTSWELAVLMNQSGTLRNTVSLPLKSTAGISEIRVDGTDVTVVPTEGDAQLFVYSGGDLLPQSAP